MSRPCPACQRALIEVPASPVAAGPATFKQLVCLDCGGRALSIETLAKVLSPLTFRRLIAGYKASRTASDRLCPLCGAQMKRIQLGVLGRTKDVEVCGHSELAWFDSHEFENLPLTSDAELELKLPHHVQEALMQIETHHGRVVANRSTFRLDAGDYGFGWRQEGEVVPTLWKSVLSLMFFLPVKREHRLTLTPWATWTTFVLVLVISMYGFANDDFIDRWALAGDDLLRSNGTTLLSYFFLHGSWMHILGNLYFLWFFGESVEDELGRTNFVLTLLTGTVGAGLAHAYLHPGGYAMLVGASGGISTLGMVYMLRFPRARLGFFVIVGWIRVPAYLLMGIWIAMQINLAYRQIAGLTQVSALAHLGGALIGLGSFLIFLRRPPHERAENID